MSESNRLQINWVNSAGGALGAVSSAVVLSSLGAAGTLIGAAVGSLCITVGGAVYSHYLAMTKDRVAAQAQAARRGSRGRDTTPAGTKAVPQPEDRPSAEDPGPAAGAREGRFGAHLLRGLPWKRIAVISAALFAVAMVIIVAFELTTGRAVSTYTGGTSNTSVGTSIPGWSGTGQQAPGGAEDVPTPDDVQDDGAPEEPAPAEDGDPPQDPAPAEDGDPPPDPAPAEGGDQPQDPAPPADAPAQEPAPEPAPEQPAP